MNVLVHGLYKDYANRRVLDVEKLEIKNGKCYAVLGLNGSGKSTLMECIAGLLTPGGGQITYDNQPYEKVRRNVAMMLQKPYMFDKTVFDNIISGLEFQGIDKGEALKRINKYLSYFDLEHVLQKNAQTLSGGEAAKTALLRTVVLETELIILDEPTASMDMESTLKAEKLIKDVVAKNRVVVLVTHDLFQARRIADEIIVMDKGRIIEQGDTKSVFQNPHNKLMQKMVNA